MAYRSLLLSAALLLALAPAAHAGYAQAVPPPGFTTASGVPVYKAPAGTAANAGFFRGFTSVPGVPTTLPYAMRFASNAPRYAFQHAVKNPRLFTPAGAAVAALPFMLEWLGDKYRFQNEEFQRKVSGGDANCPQTQTDSYCPAYGPLPSGYCVSGSFTIIDGGTGQPTTCHYIAPIGDPLPETWVPVEPTHVPPATPETFPTELPELLPYPLPVDLPVINPSPGTNPKPQPLNIPASDPVPVPNTNPQEYRQPWTVIEPSPTPSSPWRVNVRPGETVTTDPTPVPEPVTTPVPDPDTGTTSPADPVPEKPDADFCALNPTVVACLQKGDPGTLDPVPLFNEDKDVSQIQKTGQFGPASGTCPTGQTLHIGSTPIELGYSSICEFATMINPLVIGFAWLSAAFTFFGFARKD